MTEDRFIEILMENGYIPGHAQDLLEGVLESSVSLEQLTDDKVRKSIRSMASHKERLEREIGPWTPHQYRKRHD